MENSPPAPRLIRTWQDAEDYAAEFVRWLGWPDARATRRSGDEGIDVIGESDGEVVVAQVKMEVSPVESKVVRELRGAAIPVGAAHVILFALAGFKAPAIDWADRASVALFEFAYDGSITPANALATSLRDVAAARTSSEPSGKSARRRSGAPDTAPKPPSGPYATLHPNDLKLLSAVEKWEQPNRAQLNFQDFFPGLASHELAELAGLAADDAMRSYPVLRKLTETKVIARDQFGMQFVVLGIRDSGLRALRAWNIPVQQWRG